MQTPYIVLQNHNKQDRVRRSSLNCFTQRSEHKIFATPMQVHPFRAKSYEGHRKRSYHSQAAHQQNCRTPHTTSRTSKSIKYAYDENNQNKKTFQILLRQTLRRSHNARTENTFALHQKNIKWCNSTKKLRTNKSEIVKPNENILDFLRQVQGTKCVINLQNKTVNHKNRPKPQHSKSSEHKANKTLELELKIIQDLTQKQKQILSAPVMPIGKASKKIIEPQIVNNSKVSQLSNSSKIAISTTQCLIFSEASRQNRSFLQNCDGFFQTQTNFIRAKKKSKILTKKVTNFKKQLSDCQPNSLSQSKICSFKNNITKNCDLRIGNSINFSTQGHNIHSNHGHFNKNVIMFRKQDNIKIDGWENDDEHEPAF